MRDTISSSNPCDIAEANGLLELARKDATDVMAGLVFSGLRGILHSAA
jgi:hypothetical protein